MRLSWDINVWQEMKEIEQLAELIVEVILWQMFLQKSSDIRI